ncbi:MAG: TraR/DksA family transcriptional regulator [candidate division WWE3 bacterium]|nr:TraR/DksA family transcriptional regulator [candidate division WWE3 bacterium]
MAVLYFVVILLICFFILWRCLRNLGYSTQSIFDLFLFLAVITAIFGIIIRPIYLPATYLVGLLGFFWLVKRRKWSVFEVGDRLSLALSLGLLGLTSYTLITTSYIRPIPVIAAVAILSLLGGSFKIAILRGYRLFIFMLVSLPLLYDGGRYTLTFLVAIAILAVIGIWRRVRLKLPMDLMAQLKDKLFKKDAAIKEAQLKLPQDDPFLVKGRVDDNAPEDEVDEQLGHDQIIAETSFLAKTKLQVDKALGRVKSGQYGKCERCGQKIDPKRLEIDPAATLCIKCAIKSESNL